MKILATVLVAIIVLLSLFLLFSLGDYDRAQYGDKLGNIVLIVQISILAVCTCVFALWRRKKHMAVAFACLWIAVLCAFLGWFVHPDQVYERASSRTMDYQSALIELQLDMPSSADIEAPRPSSDPEGRARAIKVVRRELAARRLELRALDLRRAGDPEVFQSSFDSWILWGIAAAFASLGLLFSLRGIPLVAFLEGRHPFYAHVKNEQIPLYEMYFHQLLAKQRDGRWDEFDALLTEAQDHGLAADALDMMVAQWNMADDHVKYYVQSCVRTLMYPDRNTLAMPDPYTVIAMHQETEAKEEKEQRPGGSSESRSLS